MEDSNVTEPKINVIKSNEATKEIALRNYLSTNNPYILIPETWFNSEILKAARNEWGFGKNFNPYYQIGDFNNDRVLDFATLLINGKGFEDKNSIMRLVIFNGINDSSYQVAHIENFEQSYISNEFYITQKEGNLSYGVMETDVMGEFKPTDSGYKLRTK